MTLPDKITDPALDDIQSIEIDLQTLYNRFIVPIENMRSFSAPTIIDRSVINGEEFAINSIADSAIIDPSQPQESRAHTFFRMIGFPVVNSNFEYYNPGFDPTLKPDARKKNANIAEKIPDVVKLTNQLRESSARNRYATFQRQGIDASVNAIAMAVPNGIKPFLQMNPSDGFDSFNTLDKQEFSIPTRINYIKTRYTKPDGSDISNFFSSGNHILRPFNVSQNIVDAISSELNQTKFVAAPFLKTRKDTGIERDVFAKRPGIEFILRLRLKQQSETLALQETAYALGENGGFTNAELKDLVGALLNEENITDSDINTTLKNASFLEILNIDKLIKTIKAVVSLLIQTVETVSNVSDNIVWTPLPDVRGPEFGSTNSNLVAALQTTELERRVINLTIRSQDAKRQGSVSDNPEIRTIDFHLAEFENVERVFDDDLNDVKEQQLNYQLTGSNALSAIEIITGEISGLGLIDILAIYTALWAIDIKVLINMLDEKSFENLYSNNDLIGPAVQERRDNGGPTMGIQEVMQAFEAQVINILSYSDKIYQQKLGSPVDAEGGTVPLVRM